MAKQKRGGYSPEFMSQLLELTVDSPLLLIGTVKSRTKIRGTNANGAWEMLKMEVQGSDGRIASTVINDPANCPAVGEFIALPVFVGNNGGLRECRSQVHENW